MTYSDWGYLFCSLLIPLSGFDAVFFESFYWFIPCPLCTRGGLTVRGPLASRNWALKNLHLQVELKMFPILSDTVFTSLNTLHLTKTTTKPGTHSVFRLWIYVKIWRVSQGLHLWFLKIMLLVLYILRRDTWQWPSRPFLNVSLLCTGSRVFPLNREEGTIKPSSTVLPLKPTKLIYRKKWIYLMNEFMFTSKHLFL